MFWRLGHRAGGGHPAHLLECIDDQHIYAGSRQVAGRDEAIVPPSYDQNVCGITFISKHCRPFSKRRLLCRALGMNLAFSLNAPGVDALVGLDDMANSVVSVNVLPDRFIVSSFRVGRGDHVSYGFETRSVYQRTGKLVEKYDVADTGRKGGGGVYPAQDGFGWTNGVTERLLELYPDPVACARQLIAHPHN